MLATSIDINSHPGKIISPKNPLDILLENTDNSVRACEDIPSVNKPALYADRASDIRSSELLECPPKTPEHSLKFREDFTSDYLCSSVHSLNRYPKFSAPVYSEPKGCRYFESPFEWGLEDQLNKLSLEGSKIRSNDEEAKHSYNVKSSPEDMLMLESGRNLSVPSLNDIRGLSSCYSSVPTHFVSVGLLSQRIDAGELEFLKSTGKVWQVLTDRVHDLGMIIVAYYDLRDAIAAVQQLRSSRIKEHTTVNYVRISQLAKCSTLFNSFQNINDFDGKLLVSYCPPNQFTSNMQLILESCGDIREISQLPYKSSVIVEFYDIRNAVSAEEKLHRMDPHGGQYQVSFCPDEDYIERIIIFHDYRDCGSSPYKHNALINESISDMWRDEAIAPNNAHGFFYPPTGMLSNQLFPTVSAKSNDFLNDSNVSVATPPGISFDSRANGWSKVWQQKPNVNYLSGSYTPSNMPRFSSNSNPCENIVPSRNQVDIWKIAQGLDNRTTFMIRNIPNKYTQKMLLECIDETHKGEYDFVYLRIDFKNHCNVGYAFINFIDVNAVVSFIEKRVGRKWGRFNSDKICHISYANIQGKAALIEKFKNSSVMDKDPTYQPKIFHSSGSFKGLEEPFPSPQNSTTHNSYSVCWSSPKSSTKWKDAESLLDY
ncbi:hypothetical protein K7432_012125 [Basidiobolus ranarum]|uniref:RRM domain-containing protein n=1 Tax=Basidiobolus ranarum TaxID=34480 RepID=A0ABR2VSS0_9FUNG